MSEFPTLVKHQFLSHLFNASRCVKSWPGLWYSKREEQGRRCAVSWERRENAGIGGGALQNKDKKTEEKAKVVAVGWGTYLSTAQTIWQ